MKLTVILKDGAEAVYDGHSAAGLATSLIEAIARGRKHEEFGFAHPVVFTAGDVKRVEVTP